MALISCRECGREVSDAAPACPNCGVRIDAGAANGAPQNSSGLKAGGIGKQIAGELRSDASKMVKSEVRSTFHSFLRSIFGLLRKK